MIRQTSIDVYHQIKNDGLLSELRFKVYDVLYSKGPLTQKQVFRFFGSQNSTLIRSVTPRFIELERMGAIRIVDEVPCEETGHMTTRWDVTDKLPTPLTKNEPTRNELIQALCAKLEQVLRCLPPDYNDLTDSALKLIKQCEKYR